ncbi:hypothetical protein Val02_51830 [Virgisporangium aliadipatigenens]|uniref:FAD-dependent oxidoreductase n=1 Tax=Virgisporangium aliadipatigenens TaxID=741659 RepID=A0A8J4DTJ5_9ACTN|nr:FAD-dependent oxidoreductase [Virgisporangium aliadipatigenens]GIJ48297.1 hypothetical protein Val02_51830 [Virgisporangium aliadipatigenens]
MTSRSAHGSVPPHERRAARVLVIGAGPVGLAAAARLAERGVPFTVLEAGDSPGASVRRWGHVRLFTTWRHDVDPAARRLLAAAGWAQPCVEKLPTGAALVEEYLRPLADLPALRPHVRYGARVVAVRNARPLGRHPGDGAVRLDDGTELPATAVIDASGTWRTPNPLPVASAVPVVEGALPDVLGSDRERFAGRHTLVVGSGHSAATTLLALVALRLKEPGTRVSWAIRADSPARAYGVGREDPLPARGALGTRLRGFVASGAIDLHTGFTVAAMSTVDGRVAVSDGERTLDVDRVVNATGYHADPGLTAGHTIGAKSGGPEFLLSTGYAQAAAAVATVAGGAVAGEEPVAWDACARSTG